MPKRKARPGPQHFEGEPVVVDTDRAAVFRLDGVKAKLVWESDWPVIYLRLGRLGWIRFGCVEEASTVAHALREAVDEAHRQMQSQGRRCSCEA